MKLHDLRMIVSLSCEEASRLASDALDRDLSRRERWALRLHTLICRSCRRLRQQLKTLRTVLASMTDVQRNTLVQQLPKLSADCKRQIKQLLRDAARGESG